MLTDFIEKQPDYPLDRLAFACRWHRFHSAALGDLAIPGDRFPLLLACEAMYGGKDWTRIPRPVVRFPGRFCPGQFCVRLGLSTALVGHLSLPGRLQYRSGPWRSGAWFPAPCWSAAPGSWRRRCSRRTAGSPTTIAAASAGLVCLIEPTAMPAGLGSEFGLHLSRPAACW